MDNSHSKPFTKWIILASSPYLFKNSYFNNEKSNSQNVPFIYLIINSDTRKTLLELLTHACMESTWSKLKYSTCVLCNVHAVSFACTLTDSVC